MDSLLWVCPQECVAGNISNKGERVLRNGDHAAARSRLGSQFVVGGRVGSRSLFSRHCGCWGSSSSSSSPPGIQIWRTQNGSRQAVSIRAGEFFSFFFWQLYANGRLESVSFSNLVFVPGTVMTVHLTRIR
jgi:hypothetical protein